MAEKRKYKFLSGSSGHHGSVFQIKLLTLCLLRGLKRGKDFDLSSENKEDARTFDDVVYEEVETGSILMQAKHKDDGKAKITIKELFEKKSEFQLCQYLSSFCEIKGYPKILNVRLLTNIDIASGNETHDLFRSIVIDPEDIIYCTEAVKGYALTEMSRDRLRIQLTSLSNDNLSEFLEKFQLICIRDTELDQAIQGVLGDLELFDKALHENVATASYIREKVEQWYIKGSGEYLNKAAAKAFLCMWRSINYAQILKKFNISFRRRNINPGKRLIYIVDREFYPLGLLKVYQQFFEECNKGDAIMIVDPDDSLSIQKDMVEASAIPECRLLIVPLYGHNLYEDLHMETLLQNISNKEYQTVVFFSGEDTFSENVPNVQVISLSTCFDDLEETCKEAFLDATVDFQGSDVRLRDVLTPNGKANDIIDEETLLTLSRGERIKIDKVHDNEDIGSIYINREFIRDDNRYSERDLCDLVMTESDEKFVLISDGAGMGKTTVLTKITEILQGPSYSHRWVIRLDLNRYTSLFRELRQAGRESIEVQDILDSTGKVLRNNFQKKLFNVPVGVVLITDAVDEVSVAYTPMILKLLENCFTRKNIAKIIVTTRPQLENLLETELNVSSFRLELFSVDDQIEFLTKYWTTNLDLRLEEEMSRCELYARNLMEKLNRSIGHASWSFIGIPLQTRMVADIFQQSGGQQSVEWQGCREFLKSRRADVELNVDINVAKLYDMFVTKKGEIYVKKRNPQGTAEDVLNKHYRRAIEVHKKLALQSLVDREKWQLFGVYRDANDLDEDGLSDMGIVHEIGGTWIFSHQTFGEYFAAMCLWDELVSGTSCAYLQFLMGHVMVSADFIVVRSFFENILANETVPEKVLRACGSAVGQIPWNESKNIVRLAEEGRLHTLRLILEQSSDHSYLLQIEDIRGATALHAATKYLPVMEYLFRKGAKLDRRTSTGRSVLHEAVLNNCAGSVSFLLAKLNRGEVDAALRDGRTPLHLAAEGDFDDVARLLISAGADLEAKEPSLKTPLHVAAEKKAVRLATLLVEAGADVTAKTKNGQTAMDLARWNSCSVVVVGLQFDRKTIPMNKLVATTLESKIYCFDVRTQHPRKGFACLTEKAHDSTVWAVRHLPQNREIFMTTGGAGSMCLWKYNYPTKRMEKDSDGIPYGVVGDLSLLQNCTLSDQPITSFDWCLDKIGLSVCSAFDQTLRVLITTKLNLY